jgi:hypothetical protein
VVVAKSINELYKKDGKVRIISTIFFIYNILHASQASEREKKMREYNVA